MLPNTPTIEFTFVTITAVRPEDADPKIEKISGTLDDGSSSPGYCGINIHGDLTRSRMAVNLTKDAILNAFRRSGNKGVIICNGAILPDGTLDNIQKMGGTRVYPKPSVAV